MKTIKIGDGALQIELLFGEQFTHIRQDSGQNIICAEHSEALSLATAIFEHFAEWVSVDVKPERRCFAWTKIRHDMPPAISEYSYGNWFDIKGFIINPTHYQPIPQPKP